MTREEAIQVLNMVEAHGLADEAKRMAIEALSADTVPIEKYHELQHQFVMLGATFADLTEVVRCKDCRYAEHREQMPKQVYCKRDKLSTFCAVHDDDDFCKYGEQLYTHEQAWADIEGRPHGEWSITDTDDGYGGESPHLICSVCKTEPLAWSNKRFFNFCPNCGADMRPLTGTERIKCIKGGDE